ncbi:hypothetical protein PG993_010365 [Apiospora rasikravindrae]|uniref:cyclin-dependent kinase n=1 Tax=Apiospora rasikravindrae TaxID=990691 RepID=A0ABR1SM15_9PEZI
MKRDRSTHGDDGRDRGRTDRPPPRGPASGSHRGRSRSLSPYSRRAQSFRDRDYSRDDVPPPPPSDDRYDRHCEDRRARERSPDRGRRDDGAAPPKRKKRTLVSIEEGHLHRHLIDLRHPTETILQWIAAYPPEQILGGLRSLTHILHFLQKGRVETHQRPDPISGKLRQATIIQELAIRLFHLAMAMARASLQALLPLARRANVATSHASASEEAPPMSGANSIEVNFSRKGEVRSSHNSHMPPAFPSRRSNDPRHNQSPPHVTSGSSHHGSSAPQSPYAGMARGGGNAQQQYSPNDQRPPQAPSGPQAQLNNRQSSPQPPTGPAAGRGFSRGGFRGSSFSSSRGGSRGNGLTSAPLNAPTGPAASRNISGHSGENTPQQTSPPYAGSAHSDTAPNYNDHPEEASPTRPLHDSHHEEAVSDRMDDTEQMPPPTRAPPTGPAAAAPPSGPKFSFAFKPTSKAPATAPKPEISQKFSATPARRDQPVDERDHRDHRDRDLPRGTPTEPASSRARSDYQRNRNQPHPQQQRAPEPPRTRRVRKILRRPKPRPQLPSEHVRAESVYFRKPGNESVVGSGTYGKVFKGTNVYTKKLVALKKIRMEGERDGFPVTAVREIKLLQSLKHENIVNLMEVMVEDNSCYMVFEYLSHDLTGLLNHPSYKLDPAEKKHMAKQLFEGLDYLHGRGVLHRDIKAANILVSSDGILKLADFGLARFYAKHHRLDYTNRVITIWYRSPELLLGETQYTAAVDVWSAACVMVEIFTRHAIFPGDGTEINQLDKIYAILGTPNKVEWPDLTKMEWFELLRPNYRKPNVFAEKYKERVPAAAFDLLTSMFHYDPARRPTAAEVLEHAYFTTEQPPPRQATALADIGGDWHEFESKALRRAKEKQEREARQAAREANQREKDKKRPIEVQDARETKRPHLEGQPPAGGDVTAGEAMVQ